MGVGGCMEQCCYEPGGCGEGWVGVWGYMSSLLKRLKVNGSDNFKVTQMINTI